MSDPAHDGTWQVAPYHTIVPEFGTLGFARSRPVAVDPATIEVPAQRTRYLTQEMLPGLFTFPTNTGPLPVPVIRPDDPVLARPYREGHHRYLQ